MGVHLATAADFLQRTAGLIGSNVDQTFIYWAEQSALPTGANYNTYGIRINNTPSTYSAWVGWYALSGPLDDADLSPGTLNQTFQQASPAAGTKRHYSWTYTASTHTHRFYINGTLVATMVSDFSAVTFAYDLLGGDSTSLGGVTMSYSRQWKAVLSQAQIRTEMVSDRAILRTNLWGDWPLEEDLTDVSGSGGGNWTQEGTGTFVAGPTLLSNADITTAIDISTLPYTASFKIEQTGANLNPNLWFKFTPTAEDLMLGFWAFTSLAATGNFRPFTQAFFGPTSAPVSVPFDLNTTVQVPYSIPQTEGATMYLKVQHGAVDVAGIANLAISAVKNPTTTPTGKAIYVQDETFGYPAAILDASSGEVLGFTALGNGESGDVDPSNGTDVLSESWDVGETAIGMNRYSPFPTLVQVIAYPATFHGIIFHIIGSWLGGWWVSAKGADNTHATVRKVNADGTLGATTYTITHAASTQPIGIAVSPDETILYYAVTGTANVAVQRWDLVGNIAMADLVAGVANYNILQDMICLVDGSLLVGYKRPPQTDSYVKQYSAAGATVATFNLGAVGLNRLLRDPTGQSFWAWIYPVASPSDGTNRYRNIALSGGGDVVTPFTVPQYEIGNWAPAATASPSARFGPAFSCMAFVFVTAPTPAAPVVRTIRRARILPHQSDRQLRQFWSRLEVVLESGMGLTTGQGSDPQVMFRYSDDGGHKWSNQLTASAGKIGEFRRRVQYLMLGAPKDRVIEISVSDPTKWALIDAIVDYEEEDA